MSLLLARFSWQPVTVNYYWSHQLTARCELISINCRFQISPTYFSTFVKTAAPPCWKGNKSLQSRRKIVGVSSKAKQ